MITSLLPYLQTFIAIGNLAVMLWALKTFLRKPHDTLAEEVKQLKEHQVAQDLVIDNLKNSVDKSFDKHREQEKTNAVFKHVFLLLANFEVAFCQETGYKYTADLVKAKEELENYLSGK